MKTASALPVARRLKQAVTVACIATAWCRIDPASATTASSAKTFSVRDYGATGAGVVDEQMAILKTVKAASAWTNAVAGNTATVLFPAGTYAVTHMYGFYAVDLTGMHDITVQGECATSAPESCTKLIGAAATLADNSVNVVYNTFFQISGAQNISIRNFYLDKAVPFFSQGVVSNVNASAKTIDVVADSGYLPLGDNLAQRLMNIVMFFPNPASPYWDHDSAACSLGTAMSSTDHGCYNFHVLAKVNTSGNSWRFTLDKAPDASFLNGKFLLWKNLGWWYGITVDSSSNTQISNIFYTGGGGPAVHVQRSSGTTLVQNVVVDVPTGSGRLFSATSGFNGGHNRGGVVLDHVQTRRIDDDAFHFSAGAYYPALSQSGGNTVVRIGSCYAGDFLPGDKVSAWNWAKKQPMQTATVISAQVVTDASLPLFPRECELTLDTALPSLNGMQTFNPAMLGQATDSNDRIVNLSATETLTVQNSYLSSMRAHCGIIQVTATYQNNVCQNTPGAGLLVGPQFMWGEGYAAQGVLIAHNQFDSIGGTAIRISDELDSVHSRTRQAILAAATTVVPSVNNSAIQIQDDSFTNLGNVALGYDGISGLAVSVENAQNVTIGGNQYPTSAADAVVVSPFSVQGLVGP